MVQPPNGRATEPMLEVEVVIEIPRWSFLKRGAAGQFDFLSPLPCPFNYGSVRQFIGADDDYLDAIVLGPRLARGARVMVNVHGAIGLTDRGMYDDKLVCGRRALQSSERRRVLLLMRIYGRFKRVLNFCRRRRGRTESEGWQDASSAIARAHPCEDRAGQTRPVPF